MNKDDNSLWRFFASVKLALFLLFLLAATSIIGTVIPQGKPLEFYIHEFGPNAARLFQVLDLADMYSSWWFLLLLSLFSFNLIICSFDRLPNVLRLMTLDNLAYDRLRLQKMRWRKELTCKGETATIGERLHHLLGKAGFRKVQQKETADGRLLFAQKGTWTRLGVYMVHISILVIFVGGIIGSLFGFKAGVMIPEGASISTVYEFGSQRPIPLDFELRCDNFDIEYYKNGMPKEYRSDLTVIDRANDLVFTKSIEVNGPLTYHGITFYQSSYEPRQEFLVSIHNPQAKETKEFKIPYGRQVRWPGTQVSFGIINLMADRSGAASKLKIWFSDGQGEPSVFWIPDKGTAKVERPSGVYDFTVSQMYATGLQVAKDPGVWVVYFGCGLMLFGLYVAFFLSHQRLWIYIEKNDDWIYIEKNDEGASLLVAGNTNKNPAGFDRRFHALAERIQDELSTT